jgi:hypothetical protein
MKKKKSIGGTPMPQAVAGSGADEISGYHA